MTPVQSPLLSLSLAWHKLTLEQLDSSWLLVLAAAAPTTQFSQRSFSPSSSSIFCLCSSSVGGEFLPLVTRTVSNHPKQVGTVQILGPECIIVQGKQFPVNDDICQALLSQLTLLAFLRHNLFLRSLFVTLALSA